MIITTVTSKNGVPIRLTQERWNHITNSHLEINPKDYSMIMKAIENPDFILSGDTKELLAVKKKPRIKTWIVVPYKEDGSEDGFVLTAYLTTDISWLLHREIIWNKK